MSAPPSAPTNTRGLAGVVALDSKISAINGDEGTLVYQGYTIEDLARDASFEETVYLLWNGAMPNQAQLDELNAQLRAERALPDGVTNLLRATPRDANPMAVLRTAVSYLAAFDPDADADVTDRAAGYRKAIKLTAKMPTIVAAFDRLRKGLEPVAPRAEGSTAFEFLRMLTGEEPGARAEEVMDACLVLHADHGLNASTFTARVIGSTLADMYGAVAGAIGALKGPLHGGANRAVMEMLQEIDAHDLDTREYIEQKLARKEKVMGIGHRVYRTLDPRAKILGAMLEGLSEEKGEMKWYEMSVAIQSIIKEEKGLNPNVDFFSASVYYLLGIEPDLYTTIFAVSRTAGWTANLLEQWEDNRLIRPRAEYIGPRDKTILPIAER
ncbi:MAG: citrate/2-methylcitrate synthase [Bacteroidota bacterium]